jgi:hypothetical protein
MTAGLLTANQVLSAAGGSSLLSSALGGATTGFGISGGNPIGAVVGAGLAAGGNIAGEAIRRSMAPVQDAADAYAGYDLTRGGAAGAGMEARFAGNVSKARNAYGVVGDAFAWINQNSLLRYIGPAETQGDTWDRRQAQKGIDIAASRVEGTTTNNILEDAKARTNAYLADGINAGLVVTPQLADKLNSFNLMLAGRAEQSRRTIADSAVAQILLQANADDLGKARAAAFK